MEKILERIFGETKPEFYSRKKGEHVYARNVILHNSYYKRIADDLVEIITIGDSADLLVDRPFIEFKVVHDEKGELNSKQILLFALFDVEYDELRSFAELTENQIKTIREKEYLYSQMWAQG